MKPMIFEEYGNIKGQTCLFRSSKTPLYDSNGVLIGTIGKWKILLHKLCLKKQTKISFYDQLTALPNRQK